MKTVASVLGVSRSNLVERLKGHDEPCRRHHRVQDAALLPLVKRLVGERPTYGYRITALVNRELATRRVPPANHKRIDRIIKIHGLLLERHSGDRPGRVHDGKVVVMRSDLRWCSDGLELLCWNEEIVCVAFVHRRARPEIIAWRAVAGVGISASDVRHMMLEAVETRFGTLRAPHRWSGCRTTGRPTRRARPAVSPHNSDSYRA